MVVFKKNWRENNYSYFGGFFRGGVVILFTMTENGVVDEPLAGAEGGLSDPEPDPLLDEILLDVDNLVQERSQLICIVYAVGTPGFVSVILLLSKPVGNFF